jgi:adenosine deaminase
VTGCAPDLMSFIARMKWLTAVLVDGDACRRVAHEAIEDAAQEGIDYLELRFSPWFMAEDHDLTPEAVVEAVVDGVEAGVRATGLPVHLIGILSRTYGPEIARRELAALLRCRDRLVALDLAGDEARVPAELFREHFAMARDAGLAVTAHAGEVAGPESIRTSLRELGATRIGHAVRAGEEPALLDYLAEHRIGVEGNLTSNVQTRSVPSYEDHPLARHLAHGILATINTDDPTISGIDLRHEYEIAAPRAGLDRARIRQAQANALEIAFLSPAAREDLRHKHRRNPDPTHGVLVSGPGPHPGPGGAYE